MTLYYNCSYYAVVLEVSSYISLPDQQMMIPDHTWQRDFIPQFQLMCCRSFLPQILSELIDDDIWSKKQEKTSNIRNECEFLLLAFFISILVYEFQIFNLFRLKVSQIKIMLSIFLTLKLFILNFFRISNSIEILFILNNKYIFYRALSHLKIWGHCHKIFINYTINLSCF